MTVVRAVDHLGMEDRAKVVTVNGIKQDLCIAFDREEGWAEVIDQDSMGEMVRAGSEFQTHRVYGKVRWEAPEHSGPLAGDAGSA